MDRVKYYFSEKGIQRTNILHLNNSKAPSKIKCHLLTLYKTYDVTKRAPRDDNGNATLMEQGAKQDFILHYAV